MFIPSYSCTLLNFYTISLEISKGEEKNVEFFHILFNHFKLFQVSSVWVKSLSKEPLTVL